MICLYFMVANKITQYEEMIKMVSLRSFLLPEDQQIELEYWAESGDFSPSELHLMKIQDHRLFSISPRSGKLLPGQQRTVQFTYRSGMSTIVLLR